MALLKPDPCQILYGVDDVAQIGYGGPNDQLTVGITLPGQYEVEKMKKGRNRTAYIFPEKLFRKDPLTENILLEEHAGDEEYDKKEGLEEDCQAYPEKVKGGQMVGIEDVEANSSQKDDELDRCQKDLDFSPYRCVALCKLFRRVTWHDRFVLQLK